MRSRFSAKRIALARRVLASASLGALDGVAREFLFLQIRRAARKCALGDVEINFVSDDARDPVPARARCSESTRATRTGRRG